MRMGGIYEAYAKLPMKAEYRPYSSGTRAICAYASPCGTTVRPEKVIAFIGDPDDERCRRSGISAKHRTNCDTRHQISPEIKPRISGSQYEMGRRFLQARKVQHPLRNASRTLLPVKSPPVSDVRLFSSSRTQRWSSGVSAS